jgi:hypothetical protein
MDHRSSLGPNPRRKDINVAIEDEARTLGVGAGEVVDYVWHVLLRRDDFGCYAFRLEVLCDNVCCCARVSGWTGRWCLYESLEEGDMSFAVYVDCLEEIGDFHCGGLRRLTRKCRD